MSPQNRATYRNDRPGTTLLELLVAISVSAIVITLSLTVFSDILKGFMFQKSHAQTAGEMIVAKKQIDACLLGMVFVKECSDKAIICAKADADTFVTIRFAKDSLSLDNKAICRKLKDVAFSLIKKTPEGPWVLLWNAQLKKGGWFGGAAYGGR